MTESPRRAWVEAHAAELIEIAARFGARGVCLCGSVARGDDHERSDLDFYVRDFDGDPPGTSPAPDAWGRANDLVDAYRSFAPYKVDIRPLPGWPVDPVPHEANMQRDCIPLADFLGSGSA